MDKIAVYSTQGDICACHKGGDCSSPGKHPKGKWREAPQTPQPGDNTGVATGDGFWVLDVDKGKGGIEALRDLIQAHGPLPLTLAARTGGGGQHYYFSDKGVTNSVDKIAKGIDARGTGGFVVAPPSVHYTGGMYRWVDERTPISPAPAWLLSLARSEPPPKTRDNAAAQTANVARSRVPPVDRLLRAISYAEKMEYAKEGHGGDTMTYKVACVGHNFGVDEEVWYKWMLANYNPHCEPPWTDKDLRAKVTNGYTYTAEHVFGEKLAEGKEQTRQEEGGTGGGVFYAVESLKELALGQAWLEHSQKQLLSGGGGLYEYQKGHYAAVDPNDALDWVRDELQGSYADCMGKLIRLSFNVNKQDALTKAIGRVAPSMGLDAFEDKLQLGLATSDATYLISREGDLTRTEHSSDQPVSQYLDVDLSGEDTGCPKWEKFLEDLFLGAPDAKERINFLQEFLGVSACGYATAFEKSVWLLGEGSNGKSTFLSCISALLFDPKRITYSPPHTWRDPFSRIQMRTSLLNLVYEIDDKKIFNSADLKAVIGGDRTRARNLRHDFIDFSPKAGHIFAANSMPPVSDGTHGFWRKVVVIGMDRKFDEVAQNKRNLKEDFMRERAGIVRWALRGVARASKQGTYTLPRSAQSAADKWRQESDPVANFAQACLTKGKENTPLSVLYAAFSLWYGDQSGGESPKLHKRSFAKKLTEQGLARMRGGNGRGFVVKVKDAKDWPDYGSH